jgi:hypothetical protein
VVVHGVVGWFTSDLYKGIYTIDTRLTSPAYNSFHWEGFFFSSGKEGIVCGKGEEVVATIARKVRPRCVEGDQPATTDGTDQSGSVADLRPLDLHYEWSVRKEREAESEEGVVVVGNQVVANLDGRYDKVTLRLLDVGD